VIRVHPGGIKTNVAKNAKFIRGLDGSTMALDSGEEFEKAAKTTPDQAAETIVRGMERGQHRVLIGPDAKLMDRSGKQVGKYYGPPATWESMDGSKLTATQIAVAPNSTGNIPLQLVKGNPAMGSGAMSGVTYIQRVDTRGGVAPAMPCAAGNMGAKQVVKYQADYIFYKAM
jgi:hypothetical protein